MSSTPFVNHIDMNQNEIQNASFAKLAVFPSNPFLSQHFLHTVTNTPYIWD